MKVIGQLASELYKNGIRKLSVSCLDSKLLVAFEICYWCLSA